jgi:NAD(P)H dehydrogenase (quinone)
MNTPPVAITGATGRLGGRVARRLAELGVAQRLIVRDAARAPALARAEVSVASYGDREPLARALDGVETLLFVSGGESRTRLAQHFTLIDTAVASGVRHVVYTSFFGAAPDATFTLVRDHWATEQRLREAGLSYTFLRDNLYLDFFPLMMGDDGVIRGPAGRGRVAAVAQDDIADVAVAVLREPGAHAGARYELTGPAALTLDEVAATLTRHLGREVRYEEESLEEAYRSRAKYGVEKWQLDAWISTYTAIAAGELARVTGDVERVAGHAPIGLEEVLERGRGR